PARPWPGDGQPVQQRAEHWGVPALAGPAQDHQGQAVAVDELMDLGREPAAGETEGVVRRLLAQILVVPQRPLWCARGWCRAGAHGRSWSRPRPTSPAPRSRRRGPAARRGCDPGPVRSPGPVALPHRLPGTEIVGHVAPGDPAPVAVDDPLDDLPVIPPRPS